MSNDPKNNLEPLEIALNAFKGIKVITGTNEEAIIFEYESCVILDIDVVFRKTNKNFITILNDLFLPSDFNFKDKTNKKIYKHCFIETLMEELINYSSWNRVILFSNNLSKDDFRKSLVKKLKSIFGFQIIDLPIEFSQLIEKYTTNDSYIKPIIDVSLSTSSTMKSMKKIKKFFENNGLIALNEKYLDNPTHKIKLFQ